MYPCLSFVFPDLDGISLSESNPQGEEPLFCRFPIHVSVSWSMAEPFISDSSPSCFMAQSWINGGLNPGNGIDHR